MSVRDRGQASVLLVLVATALCTSLSVAMVGFGGTLIDRARAQTAADAAALASLEGGSAAAKALAQRNGATVVGFVRGPRIGEVTVTVRVGDVTATAAASDAP